MSVPVPTYPFETEQATQLLLSSEMSHLRRQDLAPKAEDESTWPGEVCFQSEDFRDLWYRLLRCTPV